MAKKKAFNNDIVQIFEKCNDGSWIMLSLPIKHLFQQIVLWMGILLKETITLYVEKMKTSKNKIRGNSKFQLLKNLL